MQGKMGKVGRVNLPGNVGKMREFLDNTLNPRSKDYFYIVQHSIVIVLRSLRYCVLSRRLLCTFEASFVYFRERLRYVMMSMSDYAPTKIRE
jgi:hypothetical protein